MEESIDKFRKEIMAANFYLGVTLLTRRALSERMGLSYSTVAKVLAGHRPFSPQSKRCLALLIGRERPSLTAAQQKQATYHIKALT